jgi:hypothetical protein
MVTTYDDIWQCFLDIKGISKDLIPSNQEDIYIEIHNAVRNYNIKTSEYETKLTYDDATETVNTKLDDNRLKLMALLIKENIYQGHLEYFEEVYQYDLKEVKSKFYQNQVTARESTISNIRQEINSIISDIEDHDFNDL